VSVNEPGGSGTSRIVTLLDASLDSTIEVTKHRCLIAVPAKAGTQRLRAKA
jgi:hypothetical protein